MYARKSVRVPESVEYSSVEDLINGVIRYYLEKYNEAAIAEVTPEKISRHSAFHYGKTGMVRAKDYRLEIASLEDKSDQNLLKQLLVDMQSGGDLSGSKVLSALLANMLCQHLNISDSEIRERKTTLERARVPHTANSAGATASTVTKIDAQLDLIEDVLKQNYEMTLKK